MCVMVCLGSFVSVGAGNTFTFSDTLFKVEFFFNSILENFILIVFKKPENMHGG